MLTTPSMRPNRPIVLLRSAREPLPVRRWSGYGLSGLAAGLFDLDDDRLGRPARRLRPRVRRRYPPLTTTFGSLARGQKRDVTPDARGQPPVTAMTLLCRALRSCPPTPSCGYLIHFADKGSAYNVACVPSRAVTWLDRVPPLPWTRAVSAPVTCRSPQNPRNWRAASITREDCRTCPDGTQGEVAPPLVLTGSAPPGAIWPSETKRPALTLGTESQILQKQNRVDS